MVLEIDDHSEVPFVEDSYLFTVSAPSAVPVEHLCGVMAGLVPAIYVFSAEGAVRETWMPATSAGMTGAAEIGSVIDHLWS